MFNMILSTREFNGYWVVALRGELDLAGAPSVAAHLSATVAADGSRVIVDLAGLEYIDPRGPGVLVFLLKCAQASGDQRQCRRRCTRSGSATPTPAAGQPRWRNLTPPARRSVWIPSRLDPHDEKAIRPAQVTSASVPTVSGHDGAAVLTARPKRRVFPGQADQIANARDFTRRVLASCPVLDEAVLLVSELATNAVEHTATGSGGHFDVIIYRDETLLIIAVKDEGSDKAPVTRSVDELAEGGRGLGLVELITDRWGYCGNERGRTVWLEMRGAVTA
jgi:serine/threonine-protein kinase RsbW